MRRRGQNIPTPVQITYCRGVNSKVQPYPSSDSPKAWDDASSNKPIPFIKTCQKTRKRTRRAHKNSSKVRHGYSEAHNGRKNIPRKYYGRLLQNMPGNLYGKKLEKPENKNTKIRNRLKNSLKQSKVPYTLI